MNSYECHHCSLPYNRAVVLLTCLSARLTAQPTTNEDGDDASLPVSAHAGKFFSSDATERTTLQKRCGKN